jgi:hypothetical protein
MSFKLFILELLIRRQIASSIASRVDGPRPVPSRISRMDWPS